MTETINVTVTMNYNTPSIESAPTNPATNGGASYGGMKDFSVESQRKMFAEEQERERKATESRRASRRMSKGVSAANGSSSEVAMSGLLSNLESVSSRKSKGPRVGEDDDDSIISDDDLSIGSEESFYVGIEPADYAQPDNLAMYGAGDESEEIREDRLGIVRASADVISRENNMEFFADEAPRVHEKGSDLHDFMAGCDISADKSSERVVDMPLNARGVDFVKKIEIDEDLANAQVYEQEAAEGKAFIEQLIGTSALQASTPTSYTDMVTPGTKGTNQSFFTPGRESDTPTNVGKRSGNFPVLSPSVLFSPFAQNSGDCEENITRQLREREIRKEASLEAQNIVAEKMMDLQKYIAEATERGGGKVDAAELARQMEKLLASNGDR